MKINTFAFLEIGRKEGASAKLVSGLTDNIVKKLLIEALPLGNPENEVFKVITIEEEIYLSFLLLSAKEDYGLALVIYFNKDIFKLNPFGFLKGIRKILSEHIRDPERNLPKSLDVDYIEPELFIDNYANFDSFIFSLLTQQKTLVIGEKEELWRFLAGLFHFIPSEMKRYLTLTANSSSFTNNVFLHAIPISDEVLKILDEKKGSHTILFLPTKVAYGKFSSPFCKKIASLFINNEEKLLENELIKFFAKAVESDDLPASADYAAENNLSLADASLLIWMRANNFDLEVPKGILEFTK
jgi:hypothetical protein